MSNSLETASLLVKAVRYEAENVLSFDLRHPDGSALAPFTAGAHVDLVLPNGLLRSYSISSDPRERDRYVIGVGRDRNSRGGSIWLHENLRPGQLIETSEPRNNFELDESADRTVLVAGGIGITPILAMTRRLAALGKDWTLHYAVRARQHAAFLDELAVITGDSPQRLRLHIDDEAGGKLLDLAGVVATSPAGTHFYCCGPQPMIDAFEKAAADRAPESRHVEHFTNDQAPDTDGGYEIELAKSSVVLSVLPGRTILETIQGAGIDVPFSCTEGICGTCETSVISGIPDHRDLVLTDQEKATNQTMMICCSGSRTPRLVLDP